MISKRTFEIFGYLFSFGYAVRLSPWKWNQDKKRLSPLSHKRFRQYKYFSMVCLALTIVTLGYYFFTILVLDIPFYEMAVLGSILGTFVLSISPSILYLNSYTQIISMLNGIFWLNEHQMAHFKLKENPEDDVSRMMTLLNSLGIPMLVFTGPAFVIMLNMDWNMWWLVPYVPLPWPEIWTALFLQFLCVVVYFTNMNIVLMYMAANVIITGVENNVCETRNPSREDKHKARQLYRVQYMLHGIIEQVTFCILPISIGVGVFNIIVILYSLITMYTVLNTWLILAMILLVMIELSILYVGSFICNKMTTTCMDSNNSYKSMDENMTKEDEAYFRSFRPIVWHVGDFFHISNDFFPGVMGFIIGKVVDLIVAYKF